MAVRSVNEKDKLFKLTLVI